MAGTVTTRLEAGETVKEWNTDEFDLHTLPAGRQVGRYPALARLEGFAHLVTGCGCGDFGPAHRGQDESAFEFIRDGLGASGVAWSLHVHGINVLRADRPGQLGTADGLATNKPGLAITAFSADCTDILIADPVARAAGSLHVGWRGTAVRGASNLVRTMGQLFGSKPADLIVGVGPSIGPCCFFANDEMQQVVKSFYGPLAQQVLKPLRQHVAMDLWQANVLDLLEAGVPRANIHVAGLCTSCRHDLFFSHQYTYLKDGTITGTFCSAIAIRDATR